MPGRYCEATTTKTIQCREALLPLILVFDILGETTLGSVNSEEHATLELSVTLLFTLHPFTVDVVRVALDEMPIVANPSKNRHL